ncbi:MAG: hemolysin III family protein [Pseudomonadota bacterium]
MARIYSLGERIADGVIHVIGVVAGLAAGITLIVMAVPTLPGSVSASLIVYAVAMIAMFSFSAAYHLIDVPHWKERLCHYDQAAIFAKIAGTYTPIAFAKIGGFVGGSLLIGIWSVALFGIGAKVLFAMQRHGLTICLYLALGWVGILAIVPVIEALNSFSLILLLVGGVVYSVGVIFHVWKALPYQKAIWHLFVLVATGLHFTAIVWAVFDEPIAEAQALLTVFT